MSNEPTSWNRLNGEQLNKLSTKRLVNVLKLARKRMNSTQRCNCCGEWVGEIYGKDSSEVELAEESTAFFNKVKAMCDERENVE